jgi:long-chain acyl-CoA synthetase
LQDQKSPFAKGLVRHVWEKRRVASDAVAFVGRSDREHVEGAASRERVVRAAACMAARGSAMTVRGDTFPALLEENARIRGDKAAIREKDLGIWQSWTWRQVRDEVRALAAGFAAIGLKRGDKLAVIGDNRPQLYWSMVAAQALGAIPVPVYQDSGAKEMKYVLEHAEIRMAVVEDQEQVDKLLEIKAEVPRLEAIVYRDPRGMRHYAQPFLHGLEAVVARGRKFAAANAGFYDAETAKSKGADAAIMLYTSGTTGAPKGVVLSFDNLVKTGRMSVELEGLTENEETLAYLPMAWVGDNMFSLGQSYTAGFCINCPESGATVMQDLRDVGPTYFFAPPAIFERILTQVMIRIEDAGWLKRRLFHHFMAAARRESQSGALRAAPNIIGAWLTLSAAIVAAAAGILLLAGASATVLSPGRLVLAALVVGIVGVVGALGLSGRLSAALGELLVFGPLKNTLGFSRMRLVYTAGEAIGPDIFKFYRAIGVPMKQLYGQTEASVYVTVQPNDQVRFDTVGVACPGVELKLAGNGEVLYRSPGVFKEYYKNPEATAETKTADGWVHTGDAGFLDREGHLRIIDRAKDVGKLKNGTLFAPKYIENKLKFFPTIKEAVAFGIDRDCVTAMISIDLEAVGNWAEKRGFPYSSYQELASKPQVGELIRGAVEQVNRDLAQDTALAGSQIKRFVLLHKELDADDGELTRSRKVRRRFIAEKYAGIVEALFGGQNKVHVEAKVTYEDGRSGTITADLAIVEAATVAAGEARAPSERRAA